MSCRGASRNVSAATGHEECAEEQRRPARARRAAGSRRPTAWPTRTAPADATPSGTMNVNAARLTAIWCAASDAGARRPASAVAAAKTPTSSVICARRRQPERQQPPHPGELDAKRRREQARPAPSLAPDDHARAGRPPSPTRAITVAQADPRDAHRRRAEPPEISSQLTNTLTMFAAIEREHHRPDHSHALQIAPERRIQEQRRARSTSAHPGRAEEREDRGFSPHAPSADDSSRTGSA